MLITPRPYQWRRIRHRWTAWSYLGLSAAAVMEFLERVAHVPGWPSAPLGTPPVILGAGAPIRHYAPSPRAEAAPLTA